MIVDRAAASEIEGERYAETMDRFDFGGADAGHHLLRPDGPAPGGRVRLRARPLDPAGQLLPSGGGAGACEGAPGLGDGPHGGAPAGQLQRSGAAHSGCHRLHLGGAAPVGRPGRPGGRRHGGGGVGEGRGGAKAAGGGTEALRGGAGPRRGGGRRSGPGAGGDQFPLGLFQCERRPGGADHSGPRRVRRRGDCAGGGGDGDGAVPGGDKLRPDGNRPGPARRNSGGGDSRRPGARPGDSGRYAGPLRFC